MKFFAKASALTMATLLTLSVTACSKPAAPAAPAPAPAAPAAEAPAAPAPAPAAEAPAGEKTKLTMWHIWTNQDDANAKSFNMVYPKWQEQNPNVEIEMDVTENEAFKTKIKTAIAANEAPDIFFAWGGGFSKPFAESGKLLAFDEYLADGTRDRLGASSLDNYTYGGKVYGLPFTMWVGTLYCNKEMFDANGLALPKTFDELMTAVKGFKDKGTVPIAVGAKDAWTAMFYQNVLAERTAGAAVCNATLAGNGSYDTPEIIQSATLLDQLVKAGAFDPGALALSFDEAKMTFLSGQVPMIYQGSWLAGDIEDPNLSQVAGKVVGMNFPAVTGGKGDPNEILGGSIDCFVVSANTKAPEISANFVKYITENMAVESFKLGAGLNPWKFDATGIEMKPLVQQIVEIGKNATGSVLAWDTFLSGEAVPKHLSLVQEIYAGSKTPAEFGAEMQKLQQK